MSELLFEIGTEEIPAGYIQPALDALAAGAANKLNDLQLGFADILTFGTPRRLALGITVLQGQQADRRVEHIGPSIKAGLDAEGRFTKAAIGFARSKGLEPEQLQRVQTDKGEYLLAVEEVKGRQAVDLLPGMLESLVREIIFPKSMRWADLNMNFARPIQWLLALYGNQPLQVHIENIPCGRSTKGHRFLAPASFDVRGIESYVQGLAGHFVLADIRSRKAMVKKEVERAVHEDSGAPGARPILHEGLLDTVTNLVEHPFGICGRFDAKFLALPEKVLVTSMREHQKYFPVVSERGRLLPFFVAVNNTRISDRKFAASGHERVLRARLSDGLFFFEEDKKFQLAERCQELDGIIFQQKLGTMREKTGRIVRLARILAESIAPELAADAERAASLCKADLLTSMVGEFPTLQGVMGRVYALHDGEKPAVAQAIEEHYLPVRAGGELPQSMLGALVGIADRMDTLAGCFAIGEKPTGNKDSFGLRRQAIGLLAVLRGLNISLSLHDTAVAAFEGYQDIVAWTPELLTELLTFIRLRFENEQSAFGMAQEVVEAASSAHFDDPVECLQRIEALNQIRNQQDFPLLAASFKRINNITKDHNSTEIEPDLFLEEAESQLFAALLRLRQEALPLLEERQFITALQAMLEIKEPLDHFFDKVMVMAEDRNIRRNRLNLLKALGELVLKVGDISKMHTF